MNPSSGWNLASTSIVAQPPGGAVTGASRTSMPCLNGPGAAMANSRRRDDGDEKDVVEVRRVSFDAFAAARRFASCSRPDRFARLRLFVVPAAAVDVSSSAPIPPSSGLGDPATP